MESARRPSAHAPIAALVLLLAAASACLASTASVDLPRVPSRCLPPAADGTLGRIFGAPRAGEPSGFVPLDRGDEAFDARLALARAAGSSIDAQSYLWHEDPCGSLLLDRLLEAADRGVRVRLLIDDFRLEGNDELDRELALHPGFELRVFNPLLHRSGLWKEVELLENLGRLDHRMHDKLFLVDGVAGVFGGRNVGDEYFGLGDEADFRDFDLLARGPVVEDLGRAFDEFWNGPWTVPLEDLVDLDAGPDDAERHARARRSLQALHAGDARLERRRSLSTDDWLVALRRARERMVEGEALVLHDAAQIEDAGATGILGEAFEAALGSFDGDVLIVTAYLVPDEALLRHVREHVDAGWRVRILTNSYASTNQPLAHAYYASSRLDLLAAGAELFEMRPDAWSHVHHRSPGSSARKLGLHAKSAVFGDEHVLVGSLNLDPRSMQLNTELGVLVRGRALAAWVRACLERELAARNAWRVERAPDGGLRWTTLGLELRDEPWMSPVEHAREWFLRLLPLRGEV